MSSHTLLLGAHMSVAGGIEKAIDRGESIGCTCIQIFTKSNRQWFAKPLTDQEVEAFHQRLKTSSISVRNIIVHAGYLINLASSDAAIRKKSITSLTQELERCEALRLPYLVLHPGAYGAATQERGLELVTQGLDEVLDRAAGKTKILLETMAGQGSTICSTFEHLAQIHKDSSHKRRLGVCVDTCHIFAAGYDLKTEEAYEHTWRQFDDIVGRDLLHAIHINDSKKGLGSRVDRHADVGAGELGLEPFRLLFNDKRFFDIPKVIETPETTEVMKDYARNMKTIRELLTTSTRHALGVVEGE